MGEMKGERNRFGPSFVQNSQEKRFLHRCHPLQSTKHPSTTHQGPNQVCPSNPRTLFMCCVVLCPTYVHRSSEGSHEVVHTGGYERIQNRIPT